MNNCRIKHILDQYDPAVLETLMLSGEWIYIGIPREIVELYLKDKEEENAKKEKADSRKSD